ncbi:subtilisin-like protease [Lentithecium fluviatile CBS 122367]|uniref:Subtilisin-like protease n=1 Tax=Lentithecium fluviatile CBS 122367 TaxID=1168545 RepID=A0A6G1IWJ7_9PLEO|nr:subtilisin-like protease [Lentithecium fluviatile CBS 122367]
MPSYKNLLLALSAVLPAVLAVPQINRVQTANTISGKWIARIEDDGILDDVLSAVLELAGIEVNNKYTIGSVQGFNFDGDDDILDILQDIGAIKSVEPDSRVYAYAPLHQHQIRQLDNGTLVSQNGSTWGLSRVSHKETGATNYIYDQSAGKDTYIYIIDTGINTEHSEFGGRATIGTSLIEGAEGEDDQGHGTHCAGTAAGSKFGVAKEANLIAVKVLGADGSGSNSGVLQGIEWAVNHAKENGHLDRAVLSMSLGGEFSQTTNDAIEQAANAGAFIAVAAGNDGEDASGYSPASAPSACTVGAIDKNDIRADFSNFGSVVDIFAPGKDITSAWIGSASATNTISGTSMACPHVAGLAAYLIGLEGPKSPLELCKRIQELALQDVIEDVGTGSPNLLAYNGNGA